MPTDRNFPGPRNQPTHRYPPPSDRTDAIRAKEDAKQKRLKEGVDMLSSGEYGRHYAMRSSRMDFDSLRPKTSYAFQSDDGPHHLESSRVSTINDNNVTIHSNRENDLKSASNSYYKVAWSSNNDSNSTASLRPVSVKQNLMKLQRTIDPSFPLHVKYDLRASLMPSSCSHQQMLGVANNKLEYENSMIWSQALRVKR